MPPLPEKHSLGKPSLIRAYPKITGTYPFLANYAPIPKLGKEEYLIIEKRKRMLASFLCRTAMHPILARDHIFHRFLENDDAMTSIFQSENYPFESHPKSFAETVLQTLKDSFAFTLRSPSDDPASALASMELSNKKIESIVNSIVKGHKSIMKRYQDLSIDMIEMGTALNALSMEEEELATVLEAVGMAIEKTQGDLASKVNQLKDVEGSYELPSFFSWNFT